MAGEVEITYNDFASDGGSEGLRAACVVTAIRLRANAVTLAPVDQGRLRNSIMWRKGWGSDAFGFPLSGGFNEAGGGLSASETIKPINRDFEVVVGSALEYAPYQEFGTRYMPAQPYLRPAGDAVRGSTASEIAKRWGGEAMAREFKSRKIRRERRPA